jgi:hypothetical protein
LWQGRIGLVFYDLERWHQKWGATTQEKFKVYHFRMKIYGVALIGCVPNDHVEGIIFASEDFL